jgi:multimeric flavodoxin WrbA
MKCLIINGSPSNSYKWGGKITESFTGKLIDEVKNVMSQGAPVEFEEIRLMDINLPYCKGCYNCFYNGENTCPHSALVQPIMQKIKEADCLILTSPVYALNVSGLIKNFFDLAAYNYHRPSFFDKKALVISSTAGGAAKSACKYMRDTLKHWGFNRVYTLPVIRMGATEVSEKHKNSCAKIADQFLDDVLSGKLYSPSFKRVFYFQLWKTMGAKTPDNADGQYWSESGLSNRFYSPNVKMGYPKKVLGKMVSSMFQKVMK